MCNRFRFRSLYVRVSVCVCVRMRLFVGLRLLTLVCLVFLRQCVYAMVADETMTVTDCRLLFLAAVQLLPPSHNVQGFFLSDEEEPWNWLQIYKVIIVDSFSIIMRFSPKKNTPLKN